MKTKGHEPGRRDLDFRAARLDRSGRLSRWLGRRVTATFFIFIIALLAGLAPFAAAQPQTEDATTSSTGKKFAIGFLPEGSDLKNAAALMEELRQFLLSRPTVRYALARGGYDDIILSPCDGPRDMVQRMAEEEFELVFATAVVYAGYTRQIGPYYEPILQTCRRGDIRSRDAGVYRQGVVFIGPSCPLFTHESLDKAEIRDLLLHSSLAVPSADSAAGYIAPRYKLLKDYGLQKAKFLFCGSDADVVKHVISGLADVGACREGELSQLLPQKSAFPFYRIIIKTDPVPTDPILIDQDSLPTRTDVGEIRARVREFFTTVQKIDPDLRVDSASRRDYEKLSDYLRDFEERRPTRASALVAHRAVARDVVTTSTAPVQPDPVATPQPKPTQTPQPKPVKTPAPASKKASPVLPEALAAPARPPARPAKKPGPPARMTPQPEPAIPTPPANEGLHPVMPLDTLPTPARPAKPTRRPVPRPTMPVRPALPEVLPSLPPEGASTPPPQPVLPQSMGKPNRLLPIRAEVHDPRRMTLREVAS